MLVKEFKRCINSDVKFFLKEKEVETLEKAARLADNQTLSHKFFLFTRKLLDNHLTHPLVINQVLVSNRVTPIRILPNPNLLVKANVTIPFQPVCNYCKHSGHIVSDCPVLKRKRKKQDEPRQNQERGWSTAN